MNRKSVVGVPIKHYFICSHIYKMAALTHCNSFMYTENIKFYHFFTHRNLHYLYERISIQQRWFDLIKKDTSVHNCSKVEYAWLWQVSWDTWWCIVGSMNRAFYTTTHIFWFPAGLCTPASLLQSRAQHSRPPATITRTFSLSPVTAQYFSNPRLCNCHGLWNLETIQHIYILSFYLTAQQA